MLPGTRASGQGRLDWPRDTILYHLRLDAPTLALADIRFVSPEFPGFHRAGAGDRYLGEWGAYRVGHP